MRHLPKIIKASGELVSFDPEKLIVSLIRAGASEELAKFISKEVSVKLSDGESTGVIYKKAFQMLKRSSRSLAGRFRLKKAIMELGPSGYPFEKYVAALLKRQGFLVQTGAFVEGHCITHEIDVVAEKEDHHYMIECKYHNLPGVSCDVKVPLYIYSRFKDVERKWLELPGHSTKFHQPWVYTNTRFTDDAIRYGECMNMKLVGWSYPSGSSLREIIDKLRLYPITCITTLTKHEKQFLLSRGIILCVDILNDDSVLTEGGIRGQRFEKVIEEAAFLSAP